MSLANRLAQLDRELDAFRMSPEVLEGVRTRSLTEGGLNLSAVDSELEALAANVVRLVAPVPTVRQPAAQPKHAVPASAPSKAERPREERPDVAPSAPPADVARPISVKPAGPTATPTPLPTLAIPPEPSAAPEKDGPLAESPTDVTDALGSELFGDLDANAFDARQESLDDVVSSDADGAPPSAFLDLASVLEKDEARGSVSPAAAKAPQESSPPVAEATSRSMPPPLRRSVSIAPPALPPAEPDRVRESYETLSEEIDLADVDDFEVVAEDGTDSALSDQAVGEAAVATASEPAVESQPDGDAEKKGNFFKKLFR